MKRNILSFLSMLIIMSCSKNLKGDGSHFYINIENDQATYHSTKECDLIGDSFDVDNYEIEGTPMFCSRCMDEQLIIICKQQLKTVQEPNSNISKVENEDTPPLEYKKYSNNEIGVSFDYPSICKLIQADGDEEQYTIEFECKKPNISLSMTRYWNREMLDAASFEIENKMDPTNSSIPVTGLGHNSYTETNTNKKNEKQHIFRKVLFDSSFYYELLVIYDADKSTLCHPLVEKFYKSMKLNNQPFTH